MSFSAEIRAAAEAPLAPGVMDSELAAHLAAWLKTEAHMWDRRGNSPEGHTFHALAVARFINGTPTP